MSDVAPTLPTSCGSLPPEGAAAPAARRSRFRGPCLRHTASLHAFISLGYFVTEQLQTKRLFEYAS